MLTIRDLHVVGSGGYLCIKCGKLISHTLEERKGHQVGDPLIKTCTNCHEKPPDELEE